MPPTAARDTVRPMAATLLLLATLVGAAGCSQGLFQGSSVKPDTPEGKICAERCDRPKSECQARQEARETECKRTYDSAQADYADCLKSGASRCRRPVSCLGADMTICDRQYDECLADCSGRMERRKQGASTDAAATPAADPAAAAGPSAATPEPMPASAPSRPAANSSAAKSP